MENEITEVTRRAIIDELCLSRMSWSGRQSEVEFLGRLFDLAGLPSYDSRCTDAAGEIWQHRIRNSDWNEDWVFTDPRFNILHADAEVFLRFLCEMVHPVVRPKSEDVTELVEMFNKHLAADGWAIVEETRISDKPVFAARRGLVGANLPKEATRKVAEELDSYYVSQQITRMQAAIDTDPELAIGTAKEFVETICKTVLRERGKKFENDDDLPHLMKETMKVLQLTPADIPEAARAAETLRVLLNNLASVPQRLAELRNTFGTGHGKHAFTTGLDSRHARLAVNAAVAVGVFLFETHKADTA